MSNNTTYALINSTTGTVENWVVWDGTSHYAPKATDGNVANLVLITPANAVALTVPTPPAPANAPTPPSQ